MKRLLSRSDLSGLKETLAHSNKTKIVSTNGCFDILHVGHVRILEAAKKLGDVLVVGINSDDSVKRLNKGPERPINTALNRAEILLALACVDYVTIFDEDTPSAFLKELKPDIHVKGSDYKPEDLEETPVVEAGGGRVHILDLIPGFSTTSTVEKLQKS